jgi:hypothetical protein
VVDRRVLAFSRVEGSVQEAPPGFAPWRIASEIDVGRFRHHVRTLFGDPGARPT